jgi:hypothetical protein
MSHMAAIHPACKVKEGLVVLVHTMKAYRENRGTASLSLNLALGGGECLALCFGHFILPGRNPTTHWIGGWMVPRAILDTLQNRKSLSPTGIQTMNCSACSLVTVPTTCTNYSTPAYIYPLWSMMCDITYTTSTVQMKSQEVRTVRCSAESTMTSTCSINCRSFELLVCMIVHITTVVSHPEGFVGRDRRCVAERLLT